MATTFTIAIPTHDRRETAVLAVRSALAQTRPAAEVLVLCDGCTDGTAEAVAALGDPRARAIELPKGPGYAYAHRNVALQTDADVVLWLADDDLLLPDHLALIGERWDEAEHDIVIGPAVIVHEDDRLEWLARDWGVADHRELIARSNHCPMASVSVRVAAARAAGGWDPAQDRAADWALWRAVLALGGRAAMTDQPSVLHFRASGRAQPWPDRVRQNTAWLARLQDPAQVAVIRRAMHHARSEREGDELRQLTALRDSIEVLVADRDEHRARADAAEAALKALEVELHAALADGEAQRAALQETLTQIYDGGWWRLRERLLGFWPVVRR